MFKKSLISALVLTSFAGAASAAGLDYNTLDLGYQREEFKDEGESFKPDGVSINGSYQLNEPFFVVGGYSRTHDRVEGIKGTLTQYNLGLGYRNELAHDVDFNAVLNYLHGKIDVHVPNEGNGSDSENGWGLSLGVRALVAEPLELAAFVTREDYNHADSEDFLGVQGVYKFSPNVGMYAGYDQSLDDSNHDRYKVGVRFSF